MRIAGGRLRGRRLASLPGAAVRPTGSRTREGIFNVLAHNAAFADAGLAGATVLDAFAGTGALGIEALSRGAGRAHFIDGEAGAVAVIRANLAALGLAAQAAVHRRDATDPGPAPAAAEIAFLDPPYGTALGAPALGALAAAGWLAPRAVVVLEHAAAERPPAVRGFEPVTRRRYGRAAVSFLRRM